MRKINTLYKLKEYSLATLPLLFKGMVGVYVWVNLNNGKKYIGSSKDIGRRLREYLNPNRLTLELRRGESRIHRAIVKYGYDSFAFKVVEKLDDGRSIDDLKSVEQKYLDQYTPEYNILKIAGSNRGHIMSPEARKKISDAKKGKPSHRKGVTLSAETRAKVSLNSTTSKIVYQYSNTDPNNLVLLNTFRSVTECIAKTGLTRHTIMARIKSKKPVNNNLYSFSPF